MSLSTRGAITYARNLQRLPLKEIQARTGVPVSTISDIACHAEKQAQIHHDNCIHLNNTAPGSRSGRPPLLHQDQIDSMLALASSTYK